jgi:hypothetical protein
MSIEIVETCPLGSECEKIKDGKLYRCKWFLELAGTHPITNEPVSERSCVMVWQVMLQAEGNKRVLGVQEATEVFRTEMVDANERSNKIIQMTALAAIGGNNGEGQENGGKLLFSDRT